MKTIWNYVFAAVAVMALAACTREPLQPEMAAEDAVPVTRAGGSGTLAALLTAHPWELVSVEADWNGDGVLLDEDETGANSAGNIITFLAGGGLQFDCSAHGGLTDNYYTNNPFTPQGVSSMTWTLNASQGRIVFGGNGYPLVKVAQNANNTLGIDSLTESVLVLTIELWGALYYLTFEPVHDPFESMTPAQIRAQADDYLVWSDEFNEGESLTSNWEFETGNYGQDQLEYCVSAPDGYIEIGKKKNKKKYYTAQISNGTSGADGGSLKLRAYKVNYQGCSYISTRISTKKNQGGAWKHGLIEMRAKLPIANGVWPAFWLLPRYGNPDVNAGNDGGELDIMEYVPNSGETNAKKRIYFSAHSKYATLEAGPDTGYTDPVTGDFTPYSLPYQFANQSTIASWHTYTLLWTDKFVKAYVDDNLYYNASNPNPGQHNLPYWGFDQEMYVKLNFALGGWGGAPANPWPNPDSNSSTVFEIDYVRVYQSGL